MGMKGRVGCVMCLMFFLVGGGGSGADFVVAGVGDGVFRGGGGCGIVGGGGGCVGGGRILLVSFVAITLCLLRTKQITFLQMSHFVTPPL